MEQIKYSIYKPAGNDTALVYGTNYTKDQKKKINNVIMERHANIEQVGFISNANKELQMAGDQGGRKKAGVWRNDFSSSVQGDSSPL